MRHPIPGAALDDRLGFLGTSGSGKTYNAGTAVEILLSRKARVVIIDPLGVWWGLRLLADGKKPSPWNVAIFGGPHGDLPLTEHAGLLVGETAATMAESCIIDLSELKSKSAERRFMVAFLETIYRKASGEPFHLIVDEADLFAPQKPSDGDQVLLGHMENIVRRGRIKGFIPWLISQRPAVLNKNVLSQVDGLLAFKLTSTQDRDALDAWIEGQADKAEGKAIKDALPTLQIGQGVAWIPGRGLLDASARFPQKVTFDSSRTPKRGEKLKRRALKPINLGQLKERLAAVDAEAKASDPKALRAQVIEKNKRIADLERELTYKSTAAPDPAAIEKAEERGFARAKKQLTAAAEKSVRDALVNLHGVMGERLAGLSATLAEEMKRAKAVKPQLAAEVTYTPAPAAVHSAPPRPATVRQLPDTRRPTETTGDLTPAKQRILNAIVWMESLGTDSVSKDTLAFLADNSPKSSAYANNLGALRTQGLIEYPSGGEVALTDAGRSLANPPDHTPTHEAIMAKVSAKLAPAQMRIVYAAAQAYPNNVSKEEIAEAVGASITSSAFANNLGRCRTLGLITYPSGGQVRADDRLFPTRRAA